MLGISTEIWGAVGTVVGGVGAIAVPIAGWALSVLRANHVAELKAVRDANKAALEAQDAAHKSSHALLVADHERLAQDVVKLGEGLTKAWAKVDELRDSAVRKSDLKEYREEVKADMKALGDRLEAAIRSLSEDIHRDKGGL